MAKAKKTPTIQTTVDAFASQRARSIKLRAAMHKATEAQDEAGKVLVAHVKKTSGGKVAYHAANGDTLIVSPQGAIDTVTAGAQKLPEPPKPATAEVAASVADLLSKGLADQARRLIDESLTKTMMGGTFSNAGQTATEQMLKADYAATERRIMDDIVQRNWDLGKGDFTIEGWIKKYPDMTQLYNPLWRHVALGRGQNAVRMYYHGAAPAPAIEQETFKSATMGPIKLSRKARTLLLENRNAVQAAVVGHDYNAKGMIVSKSRGCIAGYMSELEQRVNELTAKLNEAAKS